MAGAETIYDMPEPGGTLALTRFGVPRQPG